MGYAREHQNFLAQEGGKALEQARSARVRQEFLSRTAEALAFPAWFGHNWDAFFDCLADQSWRPGAGHLLVFEHTYGLRAYAPEVLDTALHILRDAAAAWAARGVPFRAFVAA